MILHAAAAAFGAVGKPKPWWQQLKRAAAALAVPHAHAHSSLHTMCAEYRTVGGVAGPLVVVNTVKVRGQGFVSVRTA